MIYRTTHFAIPVCALLLGVVLQPPSARAASSAAAGPVDFTVRVETVLEHDDGTFLWYHARAAAIPGSRRRGPADVVLTLQKHLKVSDYYGGLHFMRRAGEDGKWSGPRLDPALDWRPQPDGTTLSVADVTPGWHARSGRLLAVGCEVPYSPKGEQLDTRPRQHQTVYAVYDPRNDMWTPWARLEMPADARFDFSRNACSQWVVRRDGRILLPVYFGPDAKEPFRSAVVCCAFDGTRLRYETHGTELGRPTGRGLYEPSLAEYGGRWFLTLRNDDRGYVTDSHDGLHFAEPKPWTFDDGQELGSYNTQQHWLVHARGLFLVYTRRGANNDHIPRHRAPLFMARVDPERLVVLRNTEKVVIPERGGELGNFGANAVNARESWVTVSEGLWSDESRRRGARGATLVAHILWSKPNTRAPFPK